LLVANKVDDPKSTDFFEFYNLGAGDPVPVSAANGKNSGDLLDAIVERLPEHEDEPGPEVLRVAVIGRPNVGKSSFINRLLGEDRLVVSGSRTTSSRSSSWTRPACAARAASTTAWSSTPRCARAAPSNARTSAS
jgi:GTP-binding protein